MESIKKSQLWVNGLEGLKGKYLKSLLLINRDGITDLANYLIKDTDFFTAPGSANNHNNYEGGLVEHSLLVAESAMVLHDFFIPKTSNQSTLLVSLVHDICKVNFYTQSTRNAKIDGVWVKQPYFAIDDQLPLGHGEKSVIILQQFIKLTPDEMMAIRWHMMGFDDSSREYGGSMALRNAVNKYPLITLLHMADLAACYLPEVEL